METVRPSLNPNLRDFWAVRARNRVLYGGRASSKSWDAAGMAVFFAINSNIRFLCARQFQNNINESVKTLIEKQIKRFNLEKLFHITQNKITCISTGAEFLFYGLWKSIDEIKSMEGIDICWIEEAHNLTEEQWDILDPTLRKEGSQFWIIFNPRLVTDFVYRRFVTNPPASTVIKKINYQENPFLSKTMFDLIENAKLEDYEKYMHIYEGVPLESDEDSIIRRSWVMAAIDAHKKLGIEITGARRLGFDVADSGEDACATIGVHGPLAISADLWKARDDELLKSCTRVWEDARQQNAEIVYDAIGVGATAGAKFNELNELRGQSIPHRKFFAGGAVFRPDAQYAKSGVKNKDFFSNVKAQAWWLLADRFRNTFSAIRNGQKFKDDEMIFIDSSLPHLDKLIDELSTPKRDYDNAGRVKVEGKKDMMKRDIKSPNLADAFVMAYQPSIMPKTSFFG